MAGIDENLTFYPLGIAVLTISVLPSLQMTLNLPSGRFAIDEMSVI